MSLVVVIKGTEGVVLAADSRLTFTDQQMPGRTVNFDNGTKLLTFRNPKHRWVAAATYGHAAIGSRSVHSFMSELEQFISTRHPNNGRLLVHQYADEMRQFFHDRWRTEYDPTMQYDGMWFIVGGYDAGETYGSCYLFNVPNDTAVQLWSSGNQFTIRWGGQTEIVSRIILGYDPGLIQGLGASGKLDQAQIAEVANALLPLEYRIPYGVLPLQDCVDLAAFLIRATMSVHNFANVFRGVGGMVEVAAIMRDEGLIWVQRKQLHGEAAP